MIIKYADVEREKILSLSQQTLWNEEGKETLEYLRNKRNISDDVLRKFNVGYCPRNVSHDLAGRIIMPIYDPYNSLIALTTRDIEKELHLHESFDKNNYVYGLNIAKEHIRRNDKCILVEGQFDAMCLHSHGLGMTVGALGSSFSIVQCMQLSRYCSEMYIIFDPDESGEKGVKRAMEMHKKYSLYKYKIQFIPVYLTEGNDPDDFVVKYGVKELFILMKQSKDRINNNV